MSKKTVAVTILSTIFVRGAMYAIGDEVQVNEREAKELINRGVATDDKAVQIEEDNTVAIEEMSKSDLVAYAIELGIDVPKSATKTDIIKLINSLDDDSEA